MSTAILDAPTQDDAVQSFTVTFIIRRFDPDVDDEPRWQDFDVE
ncbi:MAG: succinate dehydrogenase iron-sulfur subunit, partial [Mycetocola sp.]